MNQFAYDNNQVENNNSNYIMTLRPINANQHGRINNIQNNIQHSENIVFSEISQDK